MAKKAKLFWGSLTAWDKFQHKTAGSLAPSSVVPGGASPLHTPHLHFKSEVFFQVLDDHH